MTMLENLRQRHVVSYVPEIKWNALLTAYVIDWNFFQDMLALIDIFKISISYGSKSMLKS